MLFSLVVPTYNNLSELKACLVALEAIPRTDFEVLIGVDGSTDGTVEWLESAKFHFPFRALQHVGGRNSGRSATRNLALPFLRGKYTLFMDSDMQAKPDLFEQHLKVLNKGNAISIGPVHYRNRGKNVWVRYSSERGVAKYANGAEVPFNYFITPNTALPTDFVLGCDGFDAQISRYGGEDMELGFRIHKKFAPHYYFNADAIVTTTQPKTLEEALPQLREYGATGLRYITSKWPELSHIYWVNRCDSPKLSDRFFEFLTKKPFQKVAWGLLRISPYFIKKSIISYLIVSHVHEGYRTGKYD